MKDVLEFYSNPSDDSESAPDFRWKDCGLDVSDCVAMPPEVEPPTLLVYGSIERPEPNAIRYNYCTLGPGYPWVTVTVTDGEFEIMQVDPPTEEQLAEWGAGKPL